MLKFRINDYITLKLENGKTNIYVGGELFDQCKFLLLNIPEQRIYEFNEINSIDEASEILDTSLEDSSILDRKITPEQEFWAHCSNLQAWAENRYDTRLLHSNLAFPLLKKLTELGDSAAKRVFKDEIAKRFNSGYFPTMIYLISEGYLGFFTSEEVENLLEKQESILLNSKESIAHGILSYLYLEKGDVDNANKVFEKSLSLKANPINKEIWNKLGEGFIDKEMYNIAHGLYKHILKAGPKYKYAWYYLGYISVRINRLNDGIIAFEKVLEIDTNFIEARTELSNIYMIQGKYEKAIEEYKRALEIEPENEKIWFYLALIYDDKKKYKESIRAYKKSLEINPHDDDVWNMLAYTYSEQKEYVKAVETYKRTLSLNSQKKLSWANLGLVYSQIGSYNKAIEACNEAIKLDTEFKVAWYALGYVLVELEDYKEAIKALNRALEINPDYIEALDEIAIVHARMGDFEKEMLIYERIENIKPENTDILKKHANASKDFRKKNINKIKELNEENLKLKDFINNFNQENSFEQEILNELSKKIKKYKGRNLEKSDFIIFLNQFTNPVLRKSMLLLLRRIYYYTQEKMALMIYQEIDKLPYMSYTKIFLCVLDDLWNKSNTFWSYFMKKLSNRPFSIKKSSDLLKSLTKLSHEKEIFIIFIDDVIGTGEQFISSYKRNFEKKFINNRYHSSTKIKLYLIAGVGMEESVKFISENSYLETDRIRFSKIFRSSDKAFYKSSWKNQNELTQLKEFLKSIDNKHWDGWKKDPTDPNSKGLEQLIVLEWNTPNITLSCLWKNSTTWNALFPRS